MNYRSDAMTHSRPNAPSPSPPHAPTPSRPRRPERKPSLRRNEVRFGLGLGLAIELGVDRKLHLVPHPDPTGFERLIPGEPEVAPIHLALGAEASPHIAPRILALPLVRHVEHNLSRHVPNREIADQPELTVRVSLDATAHEPNRREGLGVEEVRRAKMCVALLLARVDGRHVDGDVNVRALGL